MSVLFTLVHPPTLFSVIFTLAGVCTFHTEQIHIHSYFTLYEVIVYEVILYKVIVGRSGSIRSDTDTYTPPYTFLGAIKGVFGGKEIYTYKYTNKCHS